ncbi:hypothetical protein CTEN210_12018 [Chaetoceros tenuissimus]|uniref:Uncharacterized protein n=1 Tax=Chaetoceros tenuissimus TaxID=426638 RepID=A0AAD3D0E2_9STRA|nr:hypothetical protein CTEN210_12018 [Chaetoceros tenuissimus]
MATDVEDSESVRKRARTGEATFFTSSVSNKDDHDGTLLKVLSASDAYRAKKISTRLSVLLKEFPELKFVIDFENLQAITETAVVKYVEEKEAKKRKNQLHMNYGQKTVPLYSLPDEALSNCLAYIGKGHYGVVGLVSKKLYEAYKGEFGSETAYLEMATSVKLTNHCLSELCKTLEEKDEILKAAAVNGNVDILRAAVKNGYDLFPLIAMKKKTQHEYDNDSVDEDDINSDRKARVTTFDVYYIGEREKKNLLPSKKVNLSKLVERGHLHVLKYLYQELNYFLGLQRYCYPAIQHGQLKILEWLDSITVMKTSALHLGYMDNGTLSNKGYCDYAIKSGNVEVLKWLLQNGYEISSLDVLPKAIRTNSIDMIQYCFDIGFDDLRGDSVQDAIKETKSVEVFRKMYELGYEFRGIKEWYCRASPEHFEIIKFLRSISIPWNDGIMKDIVADGTLEMIQYARQDGCPWTNRGAEYNFLFKNHRWSLDKLDYLIDNGCILDYEHSSDLINTLTKKKELVLLHYFVGKNASFDNKLFRKILNDWYCNMWTEGISYLLEKGKNVENFQSIEEFFHKHTGFDRIKYFHGLGLPWCVDSSRNTHLLSKIACYNKLDDVKWAYKNGCKGGDLVPFVKEEWEEYGIRHEAKWRENQAFFEENGMLDKTILKKNEFSYLNSKNAQEIGDAKVQMLSSSQILRPHSAWFILHYSLLRTLVDHGYTFRSKLEKESVTKKAYIECCNDWYNDQTFEDCRKRLALFVNMGVREL